MAVQLDRAGAVQQPILESTQPKQSSQALQGKVAGEGVRVSSNSTSAFQNSFEEMSMVADRFKSKTLDKRKVKSGSELTDRIMERIQKIQSIQSTQAFKDTVSKFSQQSSLDPQNILQQAEEFSDDPLEQYALLDFAAEYFAEQGDQEKADQIKSVRNAIKDKQPTLIQLGLNTSEKAAEIIEREGINTGLRAVRENLADFVDDFSGVSEKSGDPSSGDHVRDDQSLIKSYRYLVDTYGADQFEKASLLQLEVLGADLLALNSSAPRERLQAILQDMKSLKIQSGIHDSCCDTEEQIERTYSDEQVKQFVLMENMLQLPSESWVTESTVEDVITSMNIQGLPAGILALTSIYSIVNSIPEEVFTNEETKQNTLAAVTECLDGKIEEEESMAFDDDDLD